MQKLKDIISSKYYWLFKHQGYVTNEIHNYLVEKKKSEKLTQTEFGKKLGFSKGYISQLLNGNRTFDHKLSKIVELSLAIGKVPLLDFVDIEDYIKEESLKSSSHLLESMKMNCNSNQEILTANCNKDTENNSLEKMSVDSAKLVDSSYGFY